MRGRHVNKTFGSWGSGTLKHFKKVEVLRYILGPQNKAYIRVFAGSADFNFRDLMTVWRKNSIKLSVV